MEELQNSRFLQVNSWAKQRGWPAQVECLQDLRGSWPGKAFAHNEVSEGSCAKGGSKGRKRREELESQFSFTYHFAWDGFGFEDSQTRGKWQQGAEGQCVSPCFR